MTCIDFENKRRGFVPLFDQYANCQRWAPFNIARRVDCEVCYKGPGMFLSITAAAESISSCYRRRQTIYNIILNSPGNSRWIPPPGRTSVFDGVSIRSAFLRTLQIRHLARAGHRSPLVRLNVYLSSF